MDLWKKLDTDLFFKSLCRESNDQDPSELRRFIFYLSNFKYPIGKLVDSDGKLLTPSQLCALIKSDLSLAKFKYMKMIVAGIILLAGIFLYRNGGNLDLYLDQISKLAGTKVTEMKSLITSSTLFSYLSGKTPVAPSTLPEIPVPEIPVPEIVQESILINKDDFLSKLYNAPLYAKVGLGAATIGAIGAAGYTINRFRPQVPKVSTPPPSNIIKVEAVDLKAVQDPNSGQPNPSDMTGTIMGGMYINELYRSIFQSIITTNSCVMAICMILLLFLGKNNILGSHVELTSISKSVDNQMQKEGIDRIFPSNDTIEENDALHTFIKMILQYDAKCNALVIFSPDGKIRPFLNMHQSLAKYHPSLLVILKRYIPTTTSSPSKNATKLPSTSFVPGPLSKGTPSPKTPTTKSPKATAATPPASKTTSTSTSKGKPKKTAKPPAPKTTSTSTSKTTSNKGKPTKTAKPPASKTTSNKGKPKKTPATGKQQKRK